VRSPWHFAKVYARKGTPKNKLLRLRSLTVNCEPSTVNGQQLTVFCGIFFYLEVTKLGVKPVDVKLSKQQRVWGSCGRDKTVRIQQYSSDKPVFSFPRSLCPKFL